MSQSFDRSFSKLLAVEGSSFVNNPIDKGGPTKYGITIQSWMGYIKKPCGQKEIKEMTEDMARDF